MTRMAACAKRSESEGKRAKQTCSTGAREFPAPIGQLARLRPNFDNFPACETPRLVYFFFPYLVRRNAQLEISPARARPPRYREASKGNIKSLREVEFSIVSFLAFSRS